MESIKEHSLIDNKRFISYVIDRMIPFSVILDQIDVRATYSHNIFCP